MPGTSNDSKSRRPPTKPLLANRNESLGSPTQLLGSGEQCSYGDFGASGDGARSEVPDEWIATGAKPKSAMGLTGHRLELHRCCIRFLGSILAIVLPGVAGADIRTLVSPDGRIRVEVRLPEPGTAELPRWGASILDRPVLSDCALGLETVEGGELLAGVRVTDERSRSVDEPVTVLFGKSALARDRFTERRCMLKAIRRSRVDIVFRCYDDAVALRYELPTVGASKQAVVSNESTSFGVVGEPTAWVQYLDNFKTSHEHEVTRVS